MDKILARYNELIALIEKYNQEYYVNNISAISDYEYDQLYKELVKLEETTPEIIITTSPTRFVGDVDNSLVGSDKKIEHQIRMYSLENSYSRDDIIEFIDKVKKVVNATVKKIEFVIEPKIDGAAVSIRYKGGVLVEAATRGDGVIGEDILDNIKSLGVLPVTIEDKGEVIIRGEAYMPISTFNKLNIEREAEGETLFANPRNAAAGSLKLLDSSKVASRGLKLFLYSLDLGRRFDNHFDDLKYLKDLGFPVNENCFKFSETDDIMDAIFEIEKIRDELDDTLNNKLDYELDGAVVKVNDYAIRDELGHTSKYPRFAISYKYKSESVRTKLLSVTFQVGRTGAITPVAELVSVQLSGSVIARATLHNNDEIKRLNIRIGDTVIIEKGGEVIPKIISVDRDVLNIDGREIEIPTVCPVCGYALANDVSGVKGYCINRECPAIVQGGILHFASRDAMDIKGFGVKVVEQFLEHDLIKDISDIYKLDRKKILKLEGFQSQSVDNLLEAIEQSKTQPFHRVLYGLGIKHVGRTATKLIIKQFGDIDTIMKATEEDISAIYGIGVGSASTLVSFFKDEINIKIVDQLRSNGLKFEKEPDLLNKTALDRTFVITGKLSHEREYFKDLIESYGARVSSSVSKNTDYLLAGSDAGSKLKKALELDVKVIDENELNIILTGSR